MAAVHRLPNEAETKSPDLKTATKVTAGPIQALYSNFIWSTLSVFLFDLFLTHALRREFYWQVNQDEKVKDKFRVLHAA